MPASEPANPTPIDVAIVGGGPAGLSAAIALGRSRRTVTVIDAGEPRNAPAPHAHNVFSRDGASPLELLADGADGGDVVVGHDERAHAPHASGSFGSKRDVGGSGSEARRQRSSHLSHRRSLVEVRAKQV